jgi:hypothetical protein
LGAEEVVDLLRIAARVARTVTAVPGGMGDAEDVVQFLYDTPYEWAWDLAEQIEASGLDREAAIALLYDSPKEKAWELAEELEKEGPPSPRQVVTVDELLGKK